MPSVNIEPYYQEDSRKVMCVEWVEHMRIKGKTVAGCATYTEEGRTALRETLVLPLTEDVAVGDYVTVTRSVELSKEG